MKNIEHDRKEWKRILEAASKAKYMIQTGVSGTKNLIVAKIGDATIVDAFAADERRQQQAFGEYIGYQVLAYGNDYSGEAALVNLEDGTMKIFGKGRKSGKLTLVQEFQETFTIVRVDDTNPKDRRYMKIAGTADEVLRINTMKDSEDNTMDTLTIKGIKSAAFTFSKNAASDTLVLSSGNSRIEIKGWSENQAFSSNGILFDDKRLTFEDVSKKAGF